MLRSGIAALALVLAVLPVQAERRQPSPIADRVQGLERREGLLRLHLDRGAGKLWLELAPPADDRGTVAELLYVEGLTSGLGSNPVGLDRGRLGDTRWVALRRLGPRVLLEQLNPRYRATSDDAAEREAARESFATSVLWAADAAVVEPDGRALVDFSSFLVRDAHGVARALDETGQGEFELDAARSVIDLDRCHVFPDNVELEALLTYSGSQPGAEVAGTAPAAESVTLTHHTSLIRLPDDGYRPRRFDPRAGSYPIEFHDYAAPLDAPHVERWIVRHRLQKLDPQAARSRVIEPIVFHVDRGAPEPVRAALIEGAGWWAGAFEAAGFIDAYRVELLPEGVHPLDVRYNVIEWVHRATRGWSYGGGVIDPRTGEILKGHVRLGSLRVRHDRLLFEGLAGTARTGTGAPDDPVQLALARIRQLAAHEVGHALGFAHNFAGSTYADRASVMDYPAPLVSFDAAGELDFSRAYATGAGAWDRHAVRYAYGELAPGADEEAALADIIEQGIEAGLLFLTDEDARTPAASDPRASLWDNGGDAVQALGESLRVRRHALDRFGEHNVPPGTPLAHLEEVLATVYFHHRYQLEAATKVVGGMEYHYAVRGDGQAPTRIVPGDRQRQALEVVLSILDPATLDLDDALIERIAPRPGGQSRNREMFETATWPAFDVQGAVEAAAAAVLDGLLQPERLARMIEFHRRDPSMPGLEELLDRVHERVFARHRSQTERAAEIARAIQTVTVQRLIDVAARESVRPAVRARIEAALVRIRDLPAPGTAAPADASHAAFLRAWITRFLERPASPTPEPWAPPAMPPGSPIG